MEIELKGAGVQYYSTNFQFFVLKFELKKISSLCWSKGLFVYILRGRGGSKLKINLISKPSCKNQKTFISVDLLQSTLVENHAVKAGLVENHAVKAGLRQRKCFNTTRKPSLRHFSLYPREIWKMWIIEYGI